MKIRLQFCESNILDALKNKPESLLTINIDYNLDYFNSNISLLVKEDDYFYYTENIAHIGNRWFIGGRC